MNNRPIIGISVSHNAAAETLSLRETYTNAVLRAGGLPILFPTITDREEITELLNLVDGVLLSGGGDVDPVRFGEVKIPECNEPNWKRDEFELVLIDEARKLHMPIFGICRGVQVLNVAYGGTMVQDIPSQCGFALSAHRQEEPFSAMHHEVKFTPGGLFERITGQSGMMTNSIHHQSNARLGGTLMVEAVTEDGIIEAISDREDDAVFGVQFHPEFFADQRKDAQKMFDHFVKKAKEYRCNR